MFTIPINLEQKKLDRGDGVYSYDITLKDDGWFTNITLKEKLANDFDKRVELERLNQRRKESTIKENLNIWKKKFFNTYMIPIIQDFMKFYEASIVIDIDSKAFRLVIFDSRINITNSVIERMNSLYINIDEITQEITS